jgi:hypothetical protein
MDSVILFLLKIGKREMTGMLTSVDKSYFFIVGNLWASFNVHQGYLRSYDPLKQNFNIQLRVSETCLFSCVHHHLHVHSSFLLIDQSTLVHIDDRALLKFKCL